MLWCRAVQHVGTVPEKEKMKLILSGRQKIDLNALPTSLTGLCSPQYGLTQDEFTYYRAAACQRAGHGEINKCVRALQTHGQGRLQMR